MEGRLLIGSIDDVPNTVSVSKEDNDNMGFIFLTSSTQPMSKSGTIYISVVAGKRGQSHFLQTVLPTAVASIRDSLAEGKCMCIACESGKDLSVGVALAALQLFFQDNGHSVQMDPVSTLSQGALYFDLPVADKQSIRTRLLPAAPS